MGNWFRPYINFVSISSYFWRNNLLLLLQRERYDAIVVGVQIIANWSCGDDQEVLQEESDPLPVWVFMVSMRGPTKTENKPKRKAKEFSIKFSFRLSIILANFSPWPAGLSGLSGMVAPSWPRVTRTTPVDGFQWRLIWFWKHRAEFKWNLARCAKTKTDIFV